MRVNKKTLTALGSFSAIVFFVILFMSVVKGKEEQRIERLNFIKGLFGWGSKGSTPGSTPGSTVVVIGSETIIV